MRWIVAALCLAGAALLIGASMIMNWTFWSGQESDAQTAQVLGAVSIGVDIFKATLPLVIAWAAGARHRLGAAVGTLFFLGCLAFSFFSAIGFAASSRNAVTGGREAVTLRYAAAEQEDRDIKSRLAALAATRPVAVIEATIATAKQDRRWTSTKDCTDATVDPSRLFCKELGDLRMELAAAIESQRLRERDEVLKREIDRLVAAGARLDVDPQAGLLARLSGLGLDHVQTVLTVLLALLVETGAAFGLFLALLPLRTGRPPETRPEPPPSLGEARAPAAARSLPAPTRFTRGPDGALMIE